MRKTNSFSKKNEILEINDIKEERMFLSMKETLHNPLKVIKSKELLNYFYKDNSIDKEEKESTKLNSSIKKNINFEDLEETNNKTDEKNNNKFIQEKDYEDIIFTTTPMIYPENNLDKIENEENFCNLNINTEPKKEEKETKKENKRKALNKIKNIAKEISDKINSFQICESTSKYSIEQSYPKSNINKYYKTIKDFNNQYFPFEFINYSFSDTNNEKNKKNLTSKINKVKINKNKKRENKYPDLMDNYRTYIPQNNIKLSHKEDDIYTREMALMKKKELKLEEMRKKEMEEENSELTYKPKINKKSEILSKNKMPIYKRLKQIEIEKNIKMEKIKENISKDEKNKNINLNNDNTNIIQKNKFNEEDFKNWLISNENWNAKKINKLNNIKNEVKKEQEFTEEGAFQFKPRINKNSEKLFKSNYILASIPACERLCYGTETKEDFSKRIQNEEKLDFIPEINKNYPISNKYYDFMKQDQFQIYYENMQRNKNKK